MNPEEDRRGLIERMRDGGVLLSEITEEYFNWEPDPGIGAGLASVLNSLNWLGVGVAQPYMGDDEDGPSVVWDGVFYWSDSNILHYIGRSAPSGDGEPRDIALDSDTLIQLF